MAMRRGGSVWVRRGVLLGVGLTWGCHGPETPPTLDTPEEAAVTPEPPATGLENTVPVEPPPSIEPPSTPPADSGPKTPPVTAPRLDARRSWWLASYYAGSSPESLAVGDFDGDGAPDVVIGARGSASGGRYTARVGSLRVLRNNGRGGLNNTPASRHTLNNVSGRVSAGDVNADGRLDVMIGLKSQTQVLLGQGGGVLREPDPTQRMGRLTTSNAGVWTGGGGPPVLWSLGVLEEVYNDYYPPRFHLGRLLEDGRLSQWEPLPSNFVLSESDRLDSGLNAAVADFNEDGLPDVVFSSEQSVPGTRAQARVFLGEGPGQLVPGSSLVPLQSFQRVFAADFNRDGHQDLLVLYADLRSVGVLLGSGRGTFSSAPTLTLAQQVYDVDVVELNADGVPDVVGLHFDRAEAVLIQGRGDGRLEFQGLIAVGRRPRAAASADLDADGRPELLVVETEDNTVSVYRPPDGPLKEPVPPVSCPLNPGPGSPAPVSPVAPGVRLPLGGVKEGTAGDFDGDGRMDLAFTLAQGGLRLLLHETQGQFPTRDVEAARGMHLSQPVTGDFDGDGRTDFAAVSANGGEDPNNGSRVLVFWNDARDVFSRSEELSNWGYQHGLLAGDFNGDGLTDLAMTPVESGGGGASVQLSLGQRQFRSQHLKNYNGPYDDEWVYTYLPLAAADFNGDGTRDIVHLSSHGLNVNPTAKADETLRGDGASYWGDRDFLAAADADGDGLADVITRSSSKAEPVVLMRGDGFGTLQAPMYCALPRGKQLLAWTDLNADGLADAVSLEDNGHGVTLWTMLRAPGGRWGAPRPQLLDSAPAWVLPVDLRGDSRPELAVLTKSGELLVFPPLSP